MSVAHRITEPNRIISLYRFFGMVQISSVGVLPLSIWTRYFRLGQCFHQGAKRHNQTNVSAAGSLDSPPHQITRPVHDTFPVELTLASPLHMIARRDFAEANGRRTRGAFSLRIRGALPAARRSGIGGASKLRGNSLSKTCRSRDAPARLPGQLGHPRRGHGFGGPIRDMARTRRRKRNGHVRLTAWRHIGETKP